MSIFEKATRQKLGFSSNKGILSVEDVWDLSLKDLNSLAKGYKKILKESEEEDFLEEKSNEDVYTKLAFDIVLHILNVKKAEKKSRDDAGVKKAEKEKLLRILERKQNENLETLSEEEIQAKIAELS